MQCDYSLIRVILVISMSPYWYAKNRLKRDGVERVLVSYIEDAITTQSFLVQRLAKGVFFLLR